MNHTKPSNSPTGSRSTALTLSAAALYVSFMIGCGSDLDSIDRSIERLVFERSSAIGAPAARVRRPDDDSSSESLYERRPPTSNPLAADLKFKPADEARDVSSRLEGFTADALGVRVGATPAGPVAPTKMDIFGALKQSQISARDFLSAEEDYLLAAIRLLIEQHRWTPRPSNETRATLSSAGEDGRFESAVRVVNELKATQRLPFGGEAEAAWVWESSEELRKQVGQSRYSQGSTLRIAASVPLLRGAGLIAQEDLIQSERSLIYAARTFERFRRELLVDIATDYFQLIALQDRIRNQEAIIVSLRKLQASTDERVKAGRVRAFQLNLTTNQILQSTSSLLSLREQYVLAVERFKIRLGLPVGTPLEILPLDFELPEPDISLEEATILGLEYRLDLQNRRDRVDDARRSVINSRNQLLPDLDLVASGSIPTDADTREGGVGFDTDDSFGTVGITFGLPLDREIERLQLRQSMIQLQQQKRDYEVTRDQVAVAVRASLRAIELARNQLRLAEEGVKIAQLRLEEQELNADNVDPQSVVDSENDLVNARNSRDEARRSLRSAVLNYLLESDQLRVGRDGMMEALPGMQRQAKEPGADAPEPAPGEADAPKPADPAPAEEPK